MPPKNLPNKLQQIRLGAGLSQTSLARELNHKQAALYPSHISQFERGERQPSLILALAYARFRGVSLEVLADDELSLE
jgi:DNA-binding XRE family transcriptional regulator